MARKSISIVFAVFSVIFFHSFAFASETIELLQQFIRIDTTNPPGQETRLAQWIREKLASEGIESELIEMEPGRGNLVARLRGNGSGKNLCLLGHLDVVPADAAEWKQDPFSGTIHDGKIWGRGALDMKGMVAMEVKSFLELQRQNVPLKGDVILVLTADEEAGGGKGVEFLVRRYWKKLECHVVLNEGSAGVHKMGLDLYPVQVAEKGVVWMKLRAHGNSGHGSMPTRDNAVVHLARAITTLAMHPFPLVKTKVMEQFLKRLSTRLPFPQSFGAAYFFHPILGSAVRSVAENIFSKDPTLGALFRNTVSPSMLEAGYKVNVIPSEAVGFVDARIMPGEKPDLFVKKVQKLVGEQVAVEMLVASDPNFSDFETPFFRVIGETLQKHSPNALVAPVMSAGATDSRFFREQGIPAYGIIPVMLEDSELAGLHGKDERVSVSEIEKGAQIVFDIVQKWQTEGVVR